MSRIASVKETGEEVSQADWRRFEAAVEAEVEQRPEAEPYERGTEAHVPRPIEKLEPVHGSQGRTHRLSQAGCDN